MFVFRDRSLVGSLDRTILDVSFSPVARNVPRHVRGLAYDRTRSSKSSDDFLELGDVGTVGVVPVDDQDHGDSSSYRKTVKM